MTFIYLAVFFSGIKLIQINYNASSFIIICLSQDILLTLNDFYSFAAIKLLLLTSFTYLWITYLVVKTHRDAFRRSFGPWFGQRFK